MTGADRSARTHNEVEHGRFLCQGDPERLWGWGTPAGRFRATRRADLIQEGAVLTPGVKALEIGCGTGLFTEIFSRSGATIVAVDISADLLAKARARGLPPGQISFLEKPFEDCEIDGPFDAVIGSSVLHHLDMDIAMRKIFDLLRPGGIVSFAEPNPMNPQVFLERKLHFLPIFSYVSPDETAFARWKLASQLESIGFVDIGITPFDWLHPAVPESSIPVVKFLERVLERSPILKEFAGSLYIRCRRP